MKQNKPDTLKFIPRFFKEYNYLSQSQPLPDNLAAALNVPVDYNSKVHTCVVSRSHLNYIKDRVILNDDTNLFQLLETLISLNNTTATKGSIYNAYIKGTKADLLILGDLPINHSSAALYNEYLTFCNVTDINLSHLYNTAPEIATALINDIHKELGNLIGERVLGFTRKVRKVN
jgi:hypothetical protein